MELLTQCMPLFLVFLCVFYFNHMHSCRRCAAGGGASQAGERRGGQGARCCRDGCSGGCIREAPRRTRAQGAATQTALMQSVSTMSAHCSCAVSEQHYLRHDRQPAGWPRTWRSYIRIFAALALSHYILCCHARVERLAEELAAVQEASHRTTPNATSKGITDL